MQFRSWFQFQIDRNIIRYYSDLDFTRFQKYIFESGGKNGFDLDPLARSIVEFPREKPFPDV